MLGLVVTAILDGRHAGNLEGAPVVNASSSVHFDTLLVYVAATLTLTGAVVLGGVCCCRRRKKVIRENVESKSNAAVTMELPVGCVYSKDSNSNKEIQEAGSSHQRDPVTVKLVSGSSADSSCGLGFNVYGDRTTGAIFVCEVLRSGPAKLSGKIHPGDRLLSLKVSTACMEVEDALTILSYASPYAVELCVQSANDSFRSSIERATMSGRNSRLQTVRRAHSAAGSRSLGGAGVPIVETVISAEDEVVSKWLRKPLQRSQSEIVAGHQSRTRRNVVRLHSSEGLVVVNRVRDELQRNHDELERESQVDDARRRQQMLYSAIFHGTEVSSQRLTQLAVDYTGCCLHAPQSNSDQMPVERRVNVGGGHFNVVDAGGVLITSQRVGNQARNPTELRRSAVGRKPFHLTSSSSDDFTTAQNFRQSYHVKGIDAEAIQKGRRATERQWTPDLENSEIVLGVSDLESAPINRHGAQLVQPHPGRAFGVHQNVGTLQWTDLRTMADDRKQNTVAESVVKSDAGFVRPLPKLSIRTIDSGPKAGTVAVLHGERSAAKNADQIGLFLDDEPTAIAKSFGVVDPSFVDIDLNDERSKHSDAAQLKPEVHQSFAVLSVDSKRKLQKSASADLISKFRILLSPRRGEPAQKCPIPPEVSYVSERSKNGSTAASIDQMEQKNAFSVEADVGVSVEPSRHSSSGPVGIRPSAGYMSGEVDSNNNNVTISRRVPLDMPHAMIRTAPNNVAGVDLIPANVLKSDEPIFFETGRNEQPSAMQPSNTVECFDELSTMKHSAVDVAAVDDFGDETGKKKHRQIEDGVVDLLASNACRSERNDVKTAWGKHGNCGDGGSSDQMANDGERH